MDWGRFEAKYVVTCTSCRDRWPSLRAELGRVGLGDAKFVYMFPSPYEPPVSIDLTKVRHTGWLERHPRHLQCVFGHYRAVKAAYELGASSILVMEDDVRFIKDLQGLQKYIDSLPADFGVAFFDVLNPVSQDARGWAEDLKKSAGGTLWGTSWKFRTAGCYAMSRKAMKTFVYFVEEPVIKGTEGMLRHTDNYWKVSYWPEDVKFYAACPNAAMQVQYSNSESGHRILDSYKAIGLDLGRFQ